MDNKKEKIVIDPDYIATSKALRIKEEKNKEENTLTNEKLSKVINDIFDEELSTREKQLEEVEEKIFKAQKLLHLVRYVLITSYYKKNNLEVPPDEETCTPGFDKQNRIHPAVKKLLGNNPSLDIFCSGKGKRRVSAKICDKNGSKSQVSEAKKPKLDNKNDMATPCVSSDQNVLKNRNRKKTRHRLVIGNVSKWVPSLEDNTTHKWMMYVRGAKDNPDISHIVEKVIFYLHPSYKPHDVVEIRESPFHLSRRGWGEFPLKVQIFFKSPFNKPVSIVHNLKLEKTFTGRQTLGNETLVDVYLHIDSLIQKPETITRPTDETITENSPDSYNNIFNSFNLQLQQKNNLESDYTPLDQNLAKYERLDQNLIEQKHFESLNYAHLLQSEGTHIKEEPLELNADQTQTNVDLISTRSDSAYGCSDTASMSFEHDYCDVIEEQFVDNEVEMKEDQFHNQFLLEHSYSVLSGTDNSDTTLLNQQVMNDHNVVIKGDGDSKLIFGLGDGYLRESVHNVVPKNVETNQKPLEPPRIRLLNGYVNTRNILKSKYGMTLPQNRFKSAGEVLPYLLKRFSLWNNNVKNESFKIVYPFIASSQEEFEKWPFGKKLNSEWNRAKEIKKIITERFPSLKKWSTRAIFMYARSHNYSPVITSCNFFKHSSEDLKLINSCFSQIEGDAINIGKNIEIDVNVDVEGDSTALPTSQKTYVDISDNSLKNHCAFVKEATLDCGIILRSEEISDGVIMNSAERMMLEAVKCLAEGLIRRANHHLVCRKDYRNGFSEVTTKEVEVALKERSEIQTIMEFGTKKREMELFS